MFDDLAGLSKALSTGDYSDVTVDHDYGDNVPEDAGGPATERKPKKQEQKKEPPKKPDPVNEPTDVTVKKDPTITDLTEPSYDQLPEKLPATAKQTVEAEERIAYAITKPTRKSEEIVERITATKAPNTPLSLIHI